MKKVISLTVILIIVLLMGITVTAKPTSPITYNKSIKYVINDPLTLEVTKTAPCYFSWTHSYEGDIAYQESPKMIYYNENGYSGELTYSYCDNSNWQDARDLYCKNIVGFNIVYIGTGYYTGTVTKNN